MHLSDEMNMKEAAFFLWRAVIWNLSIAQKAGRSRGVPVWYWRLEKGSSISQAAMWRFVCFRQQEAMT